MGVDYFYCNCCDRSYPDNHVQEYHLAVAALDNFTLCEWCRGDVFNKLRPVHKLTDPERLFDPRVDGPPAGVEWEYAECDVWDFCEWFWEPTPAYLNSLIELKEQELIRLKVHAHLQSVTRKHTMKTRSMSLSHAALD